MVYSCILNAEPAIQFVSLNSFTSDIAYEMHGYIQGEAASAKLSG